MLLRAGTIKRQYAILVGVKEITCNHWLDCQRQWHCRQRCCLGGHAHIQPTQSQMADSVVAFVDIAMTVAARYVAKFIYNFIQQIALFAWLYCGLLQCIRGSRLPALLRDSQVTKSVFKLTVVSCRFHEIYKVWMQEYNFAKRTLLELKALSLLKRVTAICTQIVLINLLN